MPTIDKIRNSLIEKLLSIKNENFLIALDKLISSNVDNEKPIELSEEQIEMLEMSMEDIKKGRTLTQEELESKVTQWLKENR